MLDSANPVAGVDTLHGLSIDGSGRAIAVLDTGVDNDHDFISVISEACFSNGDGTETSLCPNGQTSDTSAEAADD